MDTKYLYGLYGHYSMSFQYREETTAYKTLALVKKLNLYF